MPVPDGTLAVDSKTHRVAAAWGMEETGDVGCSGQGKVSLPWTAFQGEISNYLEAEGPQNPPTYIPTHSQQGRA